MMVALPKVQTFHFEPGKPAPEIPVAANDNVAKPTPSSIVATEWKWIDPKTIPPRRWIYGYHYIRKYISTTVSPGGLGKTSNSIVEALSMASDRSLLGERVHEQCRVWLFNEDPRDELDRRIAAACIHFGINPEEVRGRLFVDSFREQNFVAAVQAKNEIRIANSLRRGAGVGDKAASHRCPDYGSLCFDPSGFRK